MSKSLLPDARIFLLRDPFVVRYVDMQKEGPQFNQRREGEINSRSP